jgi:hypothetical protein
VPASPCWSRVPAPGLVLSLGAKVDSRQAVPREGLAQIGSTPVVSPLFWKGGLGEGNDVVQ